LGGAPVGSDPLRFTWAPIFVAERSHALRLQLIACCDDVVHFEAHVAHAAGRFFALIELCSPSVCAPDGELRFSKWSRQIVPITPSIFVSTSGMGRFLRRVPNIDSAAGCRQGDTGAQILARVG
jgi:hypothetical protein